MEHHHQQNHFLMIEKDKEIKCGLSSAIIQRGNSQSMILLHYVFIGIATLLLIAPCLGMPKIPSSNSSLTSTEELFINRKCKGEYDKCAFEALEKCCEECGKLFEDAVTTVCKDDCFTTSFFESCAETLHRNYSMQLSKITDPVSNKIN